MPVACTTKQLKDIEVREGGYDVTVVFGATSDLGSHEFVVRIIKANGLNEAEAEAQDKLAAWANDLASAAKSERR
jgi:hypothetical protein